MAAKLPGCAAATPPFGAAEFASADGFVTSVWGPAQWFVLHLTSFNYPTRPSCADKRRHARWLAATGRVLPCRYCRDNFEANLDAAGFFDPASFADREAFSRMVWRLHDAVNRMLDKPASPPYEEVRATYEAFRARCLRPSEVAQQLRTQAKPGCSEPAYTAAKPKCVLQIVPRSADVRPLVVDTRCVPKLIEGEEGEASAPSSSSSSS